MSQSTKDEVTVDHIAALHEAVKGLPKEHLRYAVRFVASNSHLKPKELKEKWVKDQSDRTEAAKQEHHRQTRVHSEFLETLDGDKRHAIAKILGVESKTAVSKATAGSTGQPN